MASQQQPRRCHKSSQPTNQQGETMPNTERIRAAETRLGEVSAALRAAETQLVGLWGTELYNSAKQEVRTLRRRVAETARELKAAEAEQQTQAV